MKHLLILGLVIACNGIFANDKNYDWDSERKRSELTEAELKQNELILKQYTEYKYLYENNSLVLYGTFHKIVRVNNDEALQQNNKIYISLHNVIEISEVKARSVNPDGRIVLLDNRNIKEIRDEEYDGGYKIFAIEGAEIGSEIEFFYRKKMNPLYYERIFMQFDVICKNSSFKLLSPSNLVFEFKTYNDLPEIKSASDSLWNIYEINVSEVKGIEKEEYSSFHNHRGRVDFKFKYNTIEGTSRSFTWPKVSAKIYENMTARTKAEQKVVDKFVKDIDLGKITAADKRIRFIENFIKTNVSIEKDAQKAELANLEFVIANKYSNGRGINRLFSAVFDHFNINYQIVVTTSRKNVSFDGEFEFYGHLDEVLFYFPETDSFLKPDHPGYRYPYVPYEFTATDGLFIERFVTGAITSGIGSVQNIPALPASESQDFMDITVSFSDDLSENNIAMERSMTGYMASFIQPYFSLISKEDKEKAVKEMAKFITPDMEILSSEAKNGEANLFSKETPFSLDYKIKTSAFIEKAGNKYIFNIGDLIGPQSEMYNDQTRTYRIENDYNRVYNRLIKVEIPSGYNVKNLEALKINICTGNENKKKVYCFISEYSLTDNLLEVRVEEIYDEIYYPVEKCEEFRKVINAAADFNKISIILEKK
jgi:hypothetical protein